MRACPKTASGDVVSTINHLLGVPHNQPLVDQLHRPHRTVAEGSVVNELIA